MQVFKSFHLYECYYYILKLRKKTFFYENKKIISMLLIYNNLFNLDAPQAWGLYFQDSATPQMEGLVELHDKINIIVYKNQTPGKS